MTTEINGLVIRETAFGENNKLLTLLTAGRGRMTVAAYGARGIKNRYMPVSQLMSYNEYVLSESKGRISVSEAASIENFRELREDIELFSLGQYFCEVMNEVTVEGEESGGLLRLILNSLYALTVGRYPAAQIKGVFELRTASLAGFMPELTACALCGDAAPEYALLDVMDGTLCCPACRENQADEEKYYENGAARQTFVLKSAVLEAMRYAVNAPPERLFSFHLDDASLCEFGQICESYLLGHLERDFETLRFYKSIKVTD